MPRTKRQGPLNPQRIAQEALAMIDKQGLETFSSRRLGARLGVEGMALYKHYPSMDALLDAVAELLIVEVQVPGPQPGGWQARVRQFARDYRQLAYRHPKSYALLATRRFTRARSLSVLDSIIGALLEEGFTPAQAVELFRAINHYCNGACLDELAGLADQQRKKKQREEPLGPGLPHLAKVASYLAPAHFEANFEAGLDALLAGFDARRRSAVNLPHPPQ
ncbi:MAG: TetR/AcrR family transcriptional regulator [Archangiaceae bacterium]|nr:TetR/AcrR family transcriptional regulator [Archangiaceae bacterium]